jgi:hypothetical protein
MVGEKIETMTPMTNIWFFFKDYFTYLTMHGFYESDSLEDRVVFLYVFIPILRQEINIYVNTWNEHRIRPQLARANHIPGRPNELYFEAPVPRYGWIPDAPFLAELKEAVNAYGTAYFSVFILANFSRSRCLPLRRHYALV